MGVYTARALSYAGVEYDILEHALTPRQIADFDTYADAWAIIHRNMEAALGVAGVTDPLEGKTLNGQALSAARSRFEGSKQRFFGQLLLSMKLPSLLPAIDEALASEHSVVIQLVSTAEALLDRRLADLSADDRAELNLDLSPREIVQDFLVNAFPTRAMESYWDEDGNERSRPRSRNPHHQRRNVHHLDLGRHRTARPQGRQDLQGRERLHRQRQRIPPRHLLQRARCQCRQILRQGSAGHGRRPYPLHPVGRW